MSRKYGFTALLLVLLFPVFGQLRLPRLISDGMVLQRDTKLKLWGWDSPGQNISIDFYDQTYRAKSDESGSWFVSAPPLKAGGPYELTVIGSDTILLNDVLVGDVWLCSGQSNMELTMERASPLYQKEIAESANPMIRQFEVPDRYNFKSPQTDFEGGNWIVSDPKSILRFSAVAYFFADSLYKKYGIPIGLINAALGGSPAQAWMSEEGLMAFPEYLEEKHKYRDDQLIEEIETVDQQRSNEWYGRSSSNDAGLLSSPDWHSPGLDDSDWSTMNLPGYWSDGPLGEVNGIVWFRRTFDIHQENAGMPAALELGRIVDADSVFVNGTFVGRTTYQYPPRRYQIPAGVLKSGENSMVVRVISNAGRGGFVPDKKYEVRFDDEVIDLTGEWKYRLGAKMEPLAEQTFIRWMSGGLYNAMIAPILDYSIRGVIWYQGESNANRDAYGYRSLFQALISDWRSKFGQGEFPFLYVQLPNFMEPSEQPVSSNWAMLRESQLLALDEPNTAMVVATDLGEWNDIHPLNKKDVGQRLALAAMNKAYGESLTYSGPIYKHMEIKGSNVILSFDHIGDGLVAMDGELEGFAIAGEDQQLQWAQASIKGNTVIVSHPKIKKPVAVRYGWADNPDMANLYNSAGLPAAPFRTDSWEK